MVPTTSIMKHTPSVIGTQVSIDIKTRVCGISGSALREVMGSILGPKHAKDVKSCTYC